MDWYFGTEMRAVGCQDFESEDEVDLFCCGIEARANVGGNKERESTFLKSIS